MGSFWILRIGHRLPRDVRTTTHVALVARALGARGMIYTGERDEGMENSVTQLSRKWGGKFSVKFASGWKPVLTKFRREKMKIVHLTMYGMPLKRGAKMPKSALVVVGGEKVPSEVYHLSDENVAVTSQPHSEVGALAVWLWEATKGKDGKYAGAKIKVLPQKKGKKIKT